MKRGLIITGLLLIPILVYAAVPFADQSSIISFMLPRRLLPQNNGALALDDQAQLLGLYNGQFASTTQRNKVNILYLRRLVKQ